MSAGWADLDGRLYLFYSSLYILAIDAILYPSDLITTRLQANSFTSQSSLLLTFKAVVRNEGLKGLFKGFTVTSQLVYYLAYEKTSSFLQTCMSSHSDRYKSSRWGSALEVARHSLAGFIAEVVSAFSYLPTDIVSQRLQVNAHASFLSSKFRHDTTKQVVRYIWRTEGIRGFLRGYWAYLAVYGPSSAIWWPSYEVGKDLYRRIDAHVFGNFARQSPRSDSLCYIASGCFAGVVTSTLTNPLEVAKTRIQLLEVNCSADAIKLKSGLAKTVMDIYRTEGWGAFLKGLKPRLIIRVPGSAISLWGYEIIKKLSLSDREASEL